MEDGCTGSRHAEAGRLERRTCPTGLHHRGETAGMEDGCTGSRHAEAGRLERRTCPTGLHHRGGTAGMEDGAASQTSPPPTGVRRSMLAHSSAPSDSSIARRPASVVHSAVREPPPSPAVPPLWCIPRPANLLHRPRPASVLQCAARAPPSIARRSASVVQSAACEPPPSPPSRLSGAIRAARNLLHRPPSRLCGATRRPWSPPSLAPAENLLSGEATNALAKRLGVEVYNKAIGPLALAKPGQKSGFVEGSQGGHTQTNHWDLTRYDQRNHGAMRKMPIFKPQWKFESPVEVDAT